MTNSFEVRGGSSCDGSLSCVTKSHTSVSHNCDVTNSLASAPPAQLGCQSMPSICYSTFAHTNLPLPISCELIFQRNFEQPTRLDSVWKASIYRNRKNRFYMYSTDATKNAKLNAVRVQVVYYLDCESHDWRRYGPYGKYVDKRHRKNGLTHGRWLAWIGSLV